MKQKYLLLLLLASFYQPRLWAQSASNFTIVTTAPTCSTCCDGTAGVSPLGPGCGAYTVFWTDSAGNPAGTSQQISNLCPGSSYTATITSQCGTEIQVCGFSSFPTSVEQISGAEYVLSPNPAANSISIKSPSPVRNSLVLIVNGEGKTVHVQHSNAEIDISSLPAGQFVIHIIQNDCLLFTKKFIKQ